MADFKTMVWYASFAMLCFGLGGLASYYLTIKADSHLYDVFAGDRPHAVELVEWKTSVLRSDPLLEENGSVVKPYRRARDGRQYVGTVFFKPGTTPQVWVP